MRDLRHAAVPDCLDAAPPLPIRETNVVPSEWAP